MSKHSSFGGKVTISYLSYLLMNHIYQKIYLFFFRTGYGRTYKKEYSKEILAFYSFTFLLFYFLLYLFIYIFSSTFFDTLYQQRHARLAKTLICVNFQLLTDCQTLSLVELVIKGYTSSLCFKSCELFLPTVFTNFLL